MSKLKLSENLFLEVNELQHWQQFLEQDGWKRAFKVLVKKYGIVRNEENNMFKPAKTSNGVVGLNAGLAFDSDMEGAVLREATTVSVPEGGTRRWIVIERQITNEEDGVVSITDTGDLTGVGTQFTKTLRGQPNFPTKVAFNSAVNTQFYEVVKVVSDTQAVVSGTLTTESDLKYKVVGTFTPGFQVTTDNALIYEYDGCNITVIESDSVPVLNDGQWFVASVTYADGVMSVNDERERNMFTFTQDNDAEEKNGVNPIVSLLALNNVGMTSRAVEYEMVLEHGYTVDSYEYSITQSANVFTILVGHCNAMQNTSFADDTLNGWILLNRTTMKSAKILRNVGNTLYIPTFTEGLLSDDASFVVVPDYAMIEYQIQVSAGVSNIGVNFSVLQSVEQCSSRVRLQLLQPQFGGSESVVANIRYRLIDGGGERYGYGTLAQASYNDEHGTTHYLTDSSVTISVENGEEEIRNYS